MAPTREQASVEAYLDEVRLARGHHRSLDLAIDALPDVLPRATEPDAQAGAFRVVELLAITLQAALPAQYAPAVVADSFIASRLGGEHGVTLGTPNSGLSTAAAATLVHRAFAL